MTRTTVTLTDELDIAVRREAKRRQTNVSEVMRSALSDHLGLSGEHSPFPLGRLGRSGTHDTASSIDELIQAEWRK